MAIAYQSIGTGPFTSADGADHKVTITKPSGLAEGDTMVLLVGGTLNSGDYVTPSGWTLLGKGGHASGTPSQVCVTAMYYKTASSGDAAASDFLITLTTIDGTTNEYMVGAIVRVTGTNPVVSASYFALQEDTNGGTTNTYTNSITPGAADSLLIMGVLGRGGTTPTISGYAITTSDPTWTERYDTFVNDATDFSFAVATASRPQVTATGDSTAVFSSSVDYSTGMIISIGETVVPSNAMFMGANF